MRGRSGSVAFFSMPAASSKLIFGRATIRDFGLQHGPRQVRASTSPRSIAILAGGGAFVTVSNLSLVWASELSAVQLKRDVAPTLQRSKFLRQTHR